MYTQLYDTCYDIARVFFFLHHLIIHSIFVGYRTRTKHQQEEDNVFEVATRIEDSQEREARTDSGLSQARSRKDRRSSKGKCVLA